MIRHLDGAKGRLLADFKVEIAHLFSHDLVMVEGLYSFYLDMADLRRLKLRWPLELRGGERIHSNFSENIINNKLIDKKSKRRLNMPTSRETTTDIRPQQARAMASVV